MVIVHFYNKQAPYYYKKHDPIYILAIFVLALTSDFHKRWIDW